MDYDETEQLARYVWRHCQHLLTDVERRADRAGMAEIKAVYQEQRGHGAVAQEIRYSFGHQGDPDVIAMLVDGLYVFRSRVTKRLLADPAVQAIINRCPKCGRVVRTPKAKQCLWCKHCWRTDG